MLWGKWVCVWVNRVWIGCYQINKSKNSWGNVQGKLDLVWVSEELKLIKFKSVGFYCCWSKFTESCIPLRPPPFLAILRYSVSCEASGVDFLGLLLGEESKKQTEQCSYYSGITIFSIINLCQDWSKDSSKMMMAMTTNQNTLMLSLLFWLHYDD